MPQTERSIAATRFSASVLPLQRPARNVAAGNLELALLQADGLGSIPQETSGWAGIDWLARWVLQAWEEPVRIFLGIDLDGGCEMADPEVDHPHLLKASG